MENSKIVKGKNIIIDKTYLARFYTTHKPNWVVFCEKLLDENFTVLLKIASTNSKYVTVIQNNKMLILRFSNHAPHIEHYLKYDKILCVGPKQMGMITYKEAWYAVKTFFRM